MTRIASREAAGAQPALARTVELAARPGPLWLDTARAAVIVVDMQNDFGARGGMFDRSGIDISGIEGAIAPTARALAAARKAGLPVIYLKMGFLPDLSDLGEEGSVNRARHLEFGVGQRMRAPDGRESRILIRDTWNTDIVAGLEPQPDDLVLYKTRFSGFYGTDLHERLVAIGVKELIFTGCTTSICVESTLRDAMFRDYACVLLADCTSEPIGNDLPRSNHDASLTTIEALFGWVSSSAQFEKALASRRA
jgi:nicotinamidase-related amidase